MIFVSLQERMSLLASERETRTRINSVQITLDTIKLLRMM